MPDDVNVSLSSPEENDSLNKKPALLGWFSIYRVMYAALAVCLDIHQRASEDRKLSHFFGDNGHCMVIKPLDLSFKRLTVHKVESRSSLLITQADKLSRTDLYMKLAFAPRSQIHIRNPLFGRSDNRSEVSSLEACAAD
jgi:hypothetical protein